jgi:hypothetical protein
VSPEVNTALILVQNLVAPRSTLFKPSMVLKVWRASRAVARDGSPAQPRHIRDASAQDRGAVTQAA